MAASFNVAMLKAEEPKVGEAQTWGNWKAEGSPFFGVIRHSWVFPKIEVPQNGWFMMENLIKMDDLGVPLFLETPIYSLHSLTHFGGEYQTILANLWVIF